MRFTSVGNVNRPTTTQSPSSGRSHQGVRVLSEESLNVTITKQGVSINSSGKKKENTVEQQPSHKGSTFTERQDTDNRINVTFSENQGSSGDFVETKSAINKAFASYKQSGSSDSGELVESVMNHISSREALVNYLRSEGVTTNPEKALVGLYQKYESENAPVMKTETSSTQDCEDFTTTDTRTTKTLATPSIQESMIIKPEALNIEPEVTTEKRSIIKNRLLTSAVTGVAAMAALVTAGLATALVGGPFIVLVALSVVSLTGCAYVLTSGEDPFERDTMTESRNHHERALRHDLNDHITRGMDDNPVHTPLQQAIKT